MFSFSQLPNVPPPGFALWVFGSGFSRSDFDMTAPAECRQVAEREGIAATLERPDVMRFQTASTSALDTPPAVPLEASPSRSGPLAPVKLAVSAGHLNHRHLVAWTPGGTVKECFSHTGRDHRSR